MPTLAEIRALLPALRAELQRPLSDAWSYLHVTYEHPHVERLWRPHGDGRLFLHCLHPIPDGEQALWHPHPWPCATLIMAGSYEMDLADSGRNTLLSGVFGPGSGYEMADPSAWHVVRPSVPTWSIMLTGPLFEPRVKVPKPNSPGHVLPITSTAVRVYADAWACVLASQ